MRSIGLRRRSQNSAGVLAVASLLVLIFSTAALAGHWTMYGWPHPHSGYVARPYGLSGLNATFGQRCTNGTSNITVLNWRADDNGVYYNVNVHKKVGGKPWPGWYPDKGGTSTNLNDVHGHVNDAHLTANIKSGIWGYACRTIKNSTKWSAHAWGVAVDINSAYEHVGSTHKHSHSIPTSVANIWGSHSWYWGINFGDAMHFQYVTGY